MIDRRELVGLAAIALLPSCMTTHNGSEKMSDAYGVIGQMKCVPGKRAEVIKAMLDGTQSMPGNLAYLIAEDLSDPNSLWITEVWQNRDAHAASLQLPAVQEAIGKARPHIEGFGTRVETKPVTG